MLPKYISYQDFSASLSGNNSRTTTAEPLPHPFPWLEHFNSMTSRCQKSGTHILHVIFTIIFLIWKEDCLSVWPWQPTEKLHKHTLEKSSWLQTHSRIVTHQLEDHLSFSRESSKGLHQKMIQLRVHGCLYCIC